MKPLEKVLSVMDHIIPAEGRDVSFTDPSREPILPKGTIHSILASILTSVTRESAHERSKVFRSEKPR
jgi:hypothetical protein